MIKLHGYFSDGCIIQANEDFYITGHCSPNSPISGVISGKTEQSAAAKADLNGEFCLAFSAISPSNSSYEIILTQNDDTVRLKNVRFGDVWIGAGQSNLELKLKYLYENDKLADLYRNGNFEFADVPNLKCAYEGNGFFGLEKPAERLIAPLEWKSPSITNDALETAGFSFIFVGELQKKCGYPVAIINLAVGGTNITHWLPENCFLDLPSLNAEIKFNGTKKDVGCLYNEKIYPLRGLPFKGVLWYLGESIAWTGYKTCAEYATALSRLIDLYRDLLRGEMNFVIVDIAIHGYDEFSVNCVNEQNALVCNKLKNVVECPIFDLPLDWLIPDGKSIYHPIHLVKKEEQATRAAMLAYNNFVLKKATACPQISAVDFCKNHAIVTISDCEKIFLPKNKKFFGFALASDNENYTAATAEIIGKNKIKVYSPYVESPSKLTYGFYLYNYTANVKCKTASGEVLPLLQYRTTIENPEGKNYEKFNPAFLSCEKIFDNAFSDLGGGAYFSPAWTASEIFGDKKIKFTFKNNYVTAKFGYSPENSRMVGLCPRILITNLPHGLDKYDYLTFSVQAKKALTFIGIHFKTCDGKQFYILPKVDGITQRNLQIPANRSINLTFDLSLASDVREGDFTLSRRERAQIAAMQLTFRNDEKENEVSLSDIIFHYDKRAANESDLSETNALKAHTENKDNLFVYGD